MRHGEAAENFARDFDRTLTEQGAREVAQAAERVRGKSAAVDLVIASPLVRARQTGEIMRESLGVAADVLTWEEIAPSGRAKVVADLVQRQGGHIMLVTHQPFVSMFIEYLTSESVRMNTANVASISADPVARECGELKWVV